MFDESLSESQSSNTNEKFAVISSRNHLRYNPENGFSLKDKETEWNYRVEGVWNKFSEEDNILIWVHGLDVGEEEFKDEGKNVKLSAESFNIFPILYSWNSVRPANGTDVLESADINGKKLAQFIYDLQNTDERPVHIFAHSLGAHVVSEAIDTLHYTYNYNKKISSVNMIGAAVDESWPIKYKEQIENTCDIYYNYYRTNDAILEWGEKITDWNKALGRTGVVNEDKIPQNYIEFDVTEEVDGHFEYNNPEKDSFEKIVNRII